MVLANSHKIPRVPWYSGGEHESRHRFRLRGCYPVSPNFPERLTNESICNFRIPMQRNHAHSHDTHRTTPARLASDRFRLFPVRSPLLGESRLFSLPGGTEMVHFPPFAPRLLCIQRRVTRHDPCRVAPFGNPRISACLRLPEAYRSLPRPSSPSRAKASTMCPY